MAQRWIRDPLPGEEQTIVKTFGLGDATRDVVVQWRRAGTRVRGNAMLNGERYTKRCVRRNWAGHAHELTFHCYQSHLFLAKERTRLWLVNAINDARQA